MGCSRKKLNMQAMMLYMQKEEDCIDERKDCIGVSGYVRKTKQAAKLASFVDELAHLPSWNARIHDENCKYSPQRAPDTA